MAFDAQGNFVLTEDDARKVFAHWIDKLQLSPAQFADDASVDASRFTNWVKGNGALSEAELTRLSERSEDLINAERQDVERELAAFGAAPRNSWGILGLKLKR